MAYYQPPVNPTEESTNQYVMDQVRQLLAIESLFNLKKDNKDFNSDIEYWREKPYEEIEEEIKNLLSNNK